MKNKLTALIILDGFGIAPPNEGNAISRAKKPFFDSLIKNHPTILLEASGLSVGLPRGEFGNSEVGHMTLGSGFVKYQSLPRIDNSISNGTFFNAPGLENIYQRLDANKDSNLHIMGLLGPGGVHSHIRHLEALLEWAKDHKLKERVFLHLFMDGRDTDKESGLDFMKDLLKFCKKNKIGEVATIAGRYYGMDRNRNWDRTELAYKNIVDGKSDFRFNDPVDAIKKAYSDGIYDEEINPTVIVDKKDNPIATVESGDSMIFFNFRADRAIQISRTLTDKNFRHFEVKNLVDFSMLTFTKYEEELDVDVLFPEHLIENPLSKIISENDLAQIHLAETEKYAHVTYFFNGRHEEPFAKEDWVLVSSPNVNTYDQKPSMSADELTNKAIEAVKNAKHDFMVINYANPDMVGHTGNLQATIEAIEIVDKNLMRLIGEIQKVGGSAFVVADHGNAEELINLLTGKIDKEHNIYPVPFIGIGVDGNRKGNFDEKSLALAQPTGTLADVAPTILKQLKIEIPEHMNGMGLF